MSGGVTQDEDERSALRDLQGLRAFIQHDHVRARDAVTNGCAETVPAWAGGDHWLRLQLDDQGRRTDRDVACNAECAARGCDPERPVRGYQSGAR